MDYDDFIDAKTKVMEPAGFEPLPILAPLFDWQAHVTRWAIRQGRAALNAGRRFVGSELKRSYFDQACANLKNARAQTSLAL